MVQIAKERKEEEQAYYEVRQRFTRNGKLVYAGELLQLAYQKYPKKIALICDEKSVSYEEFYFRSILLSKKLQSLGIKSRDKVILYSGNSIDFYIAYFAIWQIGAVVVPLNIFLHEKELLYVIENCEAVACFVSNDFEKKIKKISEEKEFANIRHILINKDIDWQTPVENNIEFEVEKLDQDESRARIAIDCD